MQTLGRYEIIDQLGQGAMGTVYKARDPVMDREVAIKTILVQATVGPAAAEFRERFFREAKAAGRLAHPGIVTVFDVSEHEGTPFLVMEYIAGRTLLSILQSGDRMDMRRLSELGIQLAEALDYAHKNGVVHRDIKPANILVTNDDRIKIADFGVAKLTESQQTIAGQLLGTPAFMAPEQFIGMPIDGRSDLFSLGVVIYWMATGEKPFGGDTILGVQYKVMHTDPLPPRALNPSVSQGLEAAIFKCIEKDPSRRYQTGEELARDLRTLLAGGSISTAKPLDVGPAQDRTVVMTATADATIKLQVPTSAVSRRRIQVALIVLIPFLVTAFAAAFLLRDEESGPPAPKTSTKLEARTEPPKEMPRVDIPPETTVAQTPRETTVVQRTAPIERPKPLPPAEKTKPVIREFTQPSPPPRPIDNLPFNLPVTENKTAVAQVLTSPEPPASNKTARLLITSLAAPEPLTIAVNVDNELIFSRNATIPPPFGFESLDGRFRLQSAPSVRLSEERRLLPGKHKVEVSVLLGSRRVAKVQEVDSRFDAGDLRVLQIEFLPESQGSGPNATLFKIKLK